jgi:hypothetical protein
MLQEQNIYALWAGKQTAKGTPQTTPSRRFVQTGGSSSGVARDDGSTPFSDLTKYGGRIDYPNGLTGVIEPVIAATPTELAWLLWAYHGAETVTPVTGPPTAQKHTTTPSTGLGHWLTWYYRKGLTVVDRGRHNDCLISRLQIEGSTGDKVLRATPRVLSLDPGEIQSADPAAAMPTGQALLFNEAVGTWTFDSVIVKGHTSFTFVIDEDFGTNFGDDVVVHDFNTGSPAVTIGVNVLLDADALARYNVLVYGSATPSSGTKPIRRIPALGSFSAYFTQKDAVTGAPNGKEFKLTIPGVKWAIPDKPAVNPAGGAAELQFAGEMRPTGAPAYTLDVNTDNAVVAFTT